MNNIFHRLLCLNFGSKFQAKHAYSLLRAAQSASDFTCVYCAAAGTIFRTIDVYELGFSYLSISIFTAPTLPTPPVIRVVLLHTKGHQLKTFWIQ